MDTPVSPQPQARQRTFPSLQNFLCALCTPPPAQPGLAQPGPSPSPSPRHTLILSRWVCLAWFRASCQWRHTAGTLSRPPSFAHHQVSVIHPFAPVGSSFLLSVEEEFPAPHAAEFPPASRMEKCDREIRAPRKCLPGWSVDPLVPAPLRTEEGSS